MADSIDFFPIEVEQASWQSSGTMLKEIRKAVFIEEQGVPPGEEFDGQDEQAIHWIAWGQAGKAMGTARLVGEKVGRMAILEPFRNKGVGSSLLRAIIQFGLANSLRRLRLSAQTQAIPFYRNNGFEPRGEEFMEAGIPHREMDMDLLRFSHRQYSPPLPDISEEERQRISLDGSEAFAQTALKLVRRSHRKIRIFSHHLDPTIYGSAAFSEAMYALATSHPQASILLLVRDPLWLSQNTHRLVHLYHRLSSSIQLRKLNPESHALHTDFMLIDQTGLLYKQEEDRYVGYAILHAPIEGKELGLEFDALWENSIPDPEVKRLYL